MKLTVLILTLVTAEALTLNRRDVEEGNPVAKVVKLLKDMKATAESEAKEDEEIYSKMACWCKTNDAEKTEAIKVAEGRIESLTAAIETGTARAGELKTMISGLEDEVAADRDALDQASAIREGEKEDFEAQDKDLSESSGLLKEALAVLKKVQLLQHKKPAASAAQALVQVRDLVERAAKPAKGSAYFAVMQKDLWDVFGALPGGSTENARVVTGLNQAPTGAAAGSSSYSAASSSIFGLLETMKSQIDRDLAAAHKAEINAEIGFQKLRANKEGEIQAGAQSIEEKTAELAETNQNVAQAKEDLEDTTEALSSDEKFLMDLKKRCKTADEDYAARSQTRNDEITAIGETIGILMDDDARDLTSKTMSFMQTGNVHKHEQSSKTTEASVRKHAASQLIQVARQHAGTSGGWNLALLAVSAQIDGFEKVKEMMDKMIAELKEQQKAEYEKHEACKKDIDTNEDSTMQKEAEAKDNEAKVT